MIVSVELMGQETIQWDIGADGALCRLLRYVTCSNFRRFPAVSVKLRDTMTDTLRYVH